MIAEGKLPLRVTHNDTKLINVMSIRNLTRAFALTLTRLCLTFLYDFGDSIRFGAHSRRG